jgi:hypothetical protein
MLEVNGKMQKETVFTKKSGGLKHNDSGNNDLSEILLMESPIIDE